MPACELANLATPRCVTKSVCGLFRQGEDKPALSAIEALEGDEYGKG